MDYSILLEHQQPSLNHADDDVVVVDLMLH